jgi:endonuclease YncB( thermonuclease family)
VRSSFPSPLSVPSLCGSAKAFGTLRAASFSFAAGFTAPVISVLDGDTIEVLHNNKAEPIRLSGIDCLEKRQAYDHKSGEFVALQAFGKDVTVQT